MKSCIVCSREVHDSEGQFCCPGCQAVYTIINQLGLSGQEREDRIQLLLKGVFPPSPNKAATSQKITPQRDSEIQTLESEGHEYHVLIRGMVCPACAWLIHHSLSHLPGLDPDTINLNFIAETCDLTFHPLYTSKRKIDETITSLGYEVVTDKSNAESFNYYRFGLGWFMAINAMMFSFVVYSAETYKVPMIIQYIFSFLLLILGTLTPLIASPETIRSGIRQIINRQFNMESLIVLSIFTAWIYSLMSLITFHFARLYFDVVCIILMLTETGTMISTGFYRKVSNRILSVRARLPKKVRIALDKDQFLPLEDLKPGDEFIVFREEIVPSDGFTLANGEFDFSMITGESRGVMIKKGQFIGAGAKLLSPRITLKVPQSGRSSLIERSIESTIAAFNTKKKTLTLGDKISRIFVPTIVVIALLVFIINSMFLGFHKGLVTFMSVLIVACPCAFGIAEPLVLLSGIERARKLGIQIFNGIVLTLKPDIAIFDKTGTLTKGNFYIKQIKWLVEKNNHDLNILASLERGIEHPVARVLSSLGEPLEISNRKVSETKITGWYKGKEYRVGDTALYSSPAKKMAIPEEFAHNTVVFFGDEHSCHCVIALEDELREGIPDLIHNFRKDKIMTVISSGDHQSIVNDYAQRLSVDHFYSNMRGEDKKQLITAYQKQNKKVLMIGDGINDASALTVADLGLAVFSGQIPAKMSADGVFISHQLHGLKYLNTLLKKIRRKIGLNYTWAFLYNSIGIFLAAMGKLSPTFCAIGMIFSNLVVIINSLHGYTLRKQ